jgi:hypothetical protein
VEQKIKCKGMKYGDPQGISIIACDWEGFVAFYMEDKPDTFKQLSDAITKLDSMADDHRTAMERMEP